MKLIFAGTPNFASVALEALIAAGHEICLVLTQPDRPSGRGLKLQPSSVKQKAQQHGITVLQPMGLKLDSKYSQEAQSSKTAIEIIKADAMVVVAYGLILPRWVLDAPKLGCFNIHASLLPKWRGAAPIQRAIEAGDNETGISIMQMDEGLDTGDWVMQQAMAIEPHETSASLYEKLALLGGELMVRTLQKAACYQLVRTPQSLTNISYAEKIKKSESPIDWNKSAQVIDKKIRALNPSPGSFFTFNGDVIKIRQAQPVIDYQSSPVLFDATHDDVAKVLKVTESGIDVQCGHSTVLRLLELQRSGSKRMSLPEFLRGFSIVKNDILEDKPSTKE